MHRNFTYSLSPAYPKFFGVHVFCFLWYFITVRMLNYWKKKLLVVTSLKKHSDYYSRRAAPWDPLDSMSQATSPRTHILPCFFVWPKPSCILLQWLPFFNVGIENFWNALQSLVSIPFFRELISLSSHSSGIPKKTKLAFYPGK